VTRNKRKTDSYFTRNKHENTNTMEFPTLGQHCHNEACRKLGNLSASLYRNEDATQLHCRAFVNSDP